MSCCVVLHPSTGEINLLAKGYFIKKYILVQGLVKIFNPLGELNIQYHKYI